MLLTLLMALVIFPNMLFSADKVRFANHVKTNALYTLPILAAMEKGFFKQQGLKMRYIPLRSGPALQRAVTAGALDMGTAGLLSLTRALAKGGAAVG
ncbi:MAG: ABC transporter substrate-binding protein [Thermodesulfobacteriota bacterium]